MFGLVAIELISYGKSRSYVHVYIGAAVCDTSSFIIYTVLLSRIIGDSHLLF